MEKIYKLKIYTSVIFGVILLLCAIDYTLISFLGKQSQRIWPIYHWALGFEKIPTVIYKGTSRIISCDSIDLEKPISIKEFIKKNGIKWKHNSYYKYLLGMIYNKNSLKSQRSLEAHLLSRLPCDKLVYALILVKKDLRTKKESSKLLRTITYKKH